MHHLLAIVGSPRKGGKTEQLVERVLEAAREEGAETRLFTVAGKTIAPCTACGACVKDPAALCAQHDDMDDLYPLLVWADAIVFATPVYFNSMTAQMKAVFDRMRPLWRGGRKLAGKAAAVVTVGAGRWGGQEVAAEHVFICAINHGMALPSSPDPAGWQVCAVAADPGDIARDERALRDAADLGRRLAAL
jgi:multimeric flavodoxin WrbA